MKSRHLTLVESADMRPVASKGRKPNQAYRIREHLKERREREEKEREAKALENYHGPRWWEKDRAAY